MFTVSPALAWWQTRAIQEDVENTMNRKDNNDDDDDEALVNIPSYNLSRATIGRRRGRCVWRRLDEHSRVTEYNSLRNSRSTKQTTGANSPPTQQPQGSKPSQLRSPGTRRDWERLNGSRDPRIHTCTQHSWQECRAKCYTMNTSTTWSTSPDLQ